MIRLKFYILFFVTLCVAGCIHHPQSVDGQSLRRLSSIANSHVFSATGDGHLVAFANNGLHLLDVRSGDKLTLSTASPTNIAWSADSRSFAAIIFIADYESRLVTYSADGQLLLDTVLPVAVSALYWSARGELLVTGYRLQVYRFGGNLQQTLFRSDGSGVVTVKLSDTTLKPRTTKLLERNLSQVQPVHFSPYGDEFFYVRVHDPPEFLPYLTVLSRNWQAGEGKTLLKVPLQRIMFERGTHEDSAVVVLNNERKIVESWPQSGTTHANTARYRFVDGRLYDGNTLLADWGQKSRLQILPDGRFLLAFEGTLYSGQDLQAQPVRVYSEKKWTLRRWRAAGLITPVEYHEQLDKDMK